MWFKLLGLSILLSFTFAQANGGQKVVCYYSGWSIYRPGHGNFQINRINSKLCTHLIYSFIGIHPNASIKILDQHSDIDLGGFRKFNDLKKINPNLKTLIAIGGWSEESKNYSIVASSSVLRRTFIKNALDFVNEHGFDGFDIDWEYPGQRGGAPTDKVNFGKLVREFRQTAGPDFLLTAAVGATAYAIEQSYDVPTLSKYLDFINVMTYDLHGSWEGVTGIHSALYPASHEVTASARLLNVAACIKAWISHGAAPEKLVMGIPTYGRTYTLDDRSKNGVGAPANKSGTGGPYTKESGFLGYNEICELQQRNDWTIVYNEEQQVPYAYKGKQWVGYENERSVAAKVKFAKSLNLAGYMIWAIDSDDFRGICGVQYPILHAINAHL